MEGSKFSALTRQREEAAEAEAEITPAQASAPERTQDIEPAAPRRGRPPGKRSNKDYVQMTAYVRRDVHLKAKIALLESEDSRDLSDLVDELLAGWVEQQAAS